MSLRIGQTFKHLCPFCKKIKTFKVVASQGPNRWEGQAPSCGQPGHNMMLWVNDNGKQEWPLRPGSAHFLGRDCKKRQPELGLKQAIAWLHEACSMTPTENDVAEFTRGWSE